VLQIDFLSVFPKEKEFLYCPLTGLILLAIHIVKESEVMNIKKVETEEQRPSTSTLDKKVCVCVCVRVRACVCAWGGGEGGFPKL
jgi:hypothetical protein